MRIPGLRRIRRVVGRLRDRLTRRGLILLYHRIADAPADPHQLCVTPRHFQEHLEVLRRHSTPIPLPRLVKALRDRRRPPSGVVVTFDDGYADNLLNARPLLERHGVPATVFVAAGYLGSRREFWWDEVERLVLQPGTLPETLRLQANGHAFAFELGPAARYTPEEHERYRGWNCRRPEHPGPRHPLFFALNDFLFPLSDAQRRQALDQLREKAGAEAVLRPAQRTLTPAQVHDLVRDGLVDVGAHTLTHPVLALRPRAEQAAEINGSKSQLEALLGRPVAGFAYPHGRPVAHYTEETVQLVKEAGFETACSTVSARLGRGADPLQLPRFIVFDGDGDDFARRVRAWFQGQVED
jgi:peptidoglycan/xylan/chitin deacetylase (PgdA/CDA1 family)